MLLISPSDGASIDQAGWPFVALDCVYPSRFAMARGDANVVRKGPKGLVV
jgi:hypothetical protein